MNELNSSVPQENWDDDFVFNNNSNGSRLSGSAHQGTQHSPPRVSASGSTFSEDWDTQSKRRSVHEWSTTTCGGGGSRGGFPSPPSSPPQVTPKKRIITNKTTMTVTMTTNMNNTTMDANQDNWDDDFEDSPVRRPAPPQQQQQQSPTHLRPHSRVIPTRDDSASTSDEDDDYGYVTALGEEDPTITLTAHSKRTNTTAHHPPLPMPDFGSTSLMMGTGGGVGGGIEPFPGSPTASVFSVPTSTAGRNSFTTNSSHVPLRGGGSSTNILNTGGNGGGGGSKRMTMTIFPPSSPPRNRRRLRKKSRPPHLYDNVFELVEDFRHGERERRDSSASSVSVSVSVAGVEESPVDEETADPPPSPPASSPKQHPDQVQLPLPNTTPITNTAHFSQPPSSFPHHHPSPPSKPPPNPASQPQPQPQTKSSALLSRIGSVKKWGVGVTTRRKRTSTNEGVGMETGTHNMHVRTGSQDSAVSRERERDVGEGEKNGSGWFFRVTGGEPGPPSPPPPPPLPPPLPGGHPHPGERVGVGGEDSQSHMKLTKKKPSRVFEPLLPQREKSPPLLQTQNQTQTPKPSFLSIIRRPSSLHPHPGVGGRRHVSDGSASVGRSASNTLVGGSVEDLGGGGAGAGGKDLGMKDRDGNANNGGEGEVGGGGGGGRFFGGVGVRRISLGGGIRHRRNRSLGMGGGGGVRASTPSGLESTDVEVEVRPEMVDELLPPIDLRPASPGFEPSPESAPEPELASQVQMQVQLQPPSTPTKPKPKPKLDTTSPTHNPPSPNTHSTSTSPTVTKTKTKPNRPTTPSTPSRVNNNNSPSTPSPLKRTPISGSGSGSVMGGTIMSVSTPRTPVKLKKSPGSPQQMQSASLGRATAGSGIGIGLGMGVVSANGVNGNGNGNVSGANGNGNSNGGGGGGSPVPRRNSLGDLKIPARISQAQVSLRRDIGFVREFAASIEQLKDLQTTYLKLVLEVQTILDGHLPVLSPPQKKIPQSRPTSPTFFHLPRTHSRARSNTNPIPLQPPPPSSSTKESSHNHKEVATALYTINSKYKISWECAELLVELGGGGGASVSAVSGSSTMSPPRPQQPPPTASASAPAMQQHVQDTSGESRKSRERAITLAGDEPTLPSTVTATATPAMMPPTADPPSLAWRASTGRHDLSQRQLIILREMLNHPDGTLRIPEEVAVNRAWRWGDGMNSTITLPSEEESSAAQVPASPTKKRKMGMSALRDMLRALKRTHPASAPSVPHTSDASASTESSIGDGDGRHYYSHPQILTQRRRTKTSTGPENQKHTPPSSSTPPYHPPSLTHRASPRRPSLASIFRLGQKSKSTLSGPDTSMDSIANGKNGGKHSDQSSTTEEEDWDCMDSASDFEHAAQALEAGDGMLTVKGKKGRSPYEQEQSLQPGLRPTTPRMGAAASRSSIFGGRDASPHRTRSTRLSNVEENTDDQRGSRALRKGKKRASLPVPSPTRPRSRNGLMSDSVRSAPPQSFATHDPQSISEFKLAMTPENIKPLLENAREVHTRLVECIAELRVLLAAAQP